MEDSGLEAVFRAGYESGCANGYSSTPEDEFQHYLSALKWEKRQEVLDGKGKTQEKLQA